MIRILLILFILISLPAMAETVLTGGVRYNSESAREELLANKPQPPDIKPEYTHDINYQDNIKYLMQGKVELKDRVLAFFSDSTYAVMYNADKLRVYYYSPRGNLIYTEVKNTDKYPYKTYKYDSIGRLVNMSFRVSDNETFIYTINGSLIAHWIGNYAYDNNGNIIMTRKYTS